MFSRSTLDAVNDLPIEEVINKYWPLKRQGANWKAKSPFNDGDKTPSFSVSAVKNCWACFSTNTTGHGAISFLMKFKHLEFIEAVKEICGEHGIDPEYDNARGPELAARYNRIREISEINQAAQDFWRSNLENAPEAQRNRASAAEKETFGIGYASDSWTELKDHLMTKGFSLNMMADAKLISQNKEKTSWFDFFRGRIMFPIHAPNGQLIGFSGRTVETDPEVVKKIGKVVNSAETEAYNKSESLLGIHVAKAAIMQKDKDFVIKVEGNFDMTSFHSVGMANTVATLGSAFTEAQVRLLKKYTNNFVLAVDNDKGGLGGIEPDTKLCLRNGINVDVWMSDVPGQDPDDYIKSKKWKGDQFKTDFAEKRKSAVILLAESYFVDADTPEKKHTAQNKLTDLLCNVAHAPLRNIYVKEFSQKYKIERKDVESQISTELITQEKKSKIAEDTGVRLPPGLSEDATRDWTEFGFFQYDTPDKIGYYFQNQSFAYDRITNFTLKPIMHIKGTQSKRIVELKHLDGGSLSTKICELPNKATHSLSEFEEVISNLGNFWFNGSKRHHQKLRVKHLAQFVDAHEIRTLGWQAEKFFAFANGIVVDGSFKRVDRFGISTYGDRNYFLPAFSEIYANLQAEDDVYDNDKKFIYQSTGTTFQEWADLFNQVYSDDDNGRIDIAFFIATLFSDYVFSVNNDFPMTYHFGQPKTGKTTVCRSLSRLFKSDSTPFNLNQGTVIGFTRRLARTRNVIEHMDEYRNDLDEKRFQAMKGIFDRTGHEKGVMSQDNRTSSSKITATVAASGQHLPTRDGNSLLTRMCVLKFSKEDFTAAEGKALAKLQAMEAAGLSDVIIEVIKFRDFFEKDFAEQQFKMSSRMKDDLQGSSADIRVTKNYAMLATVVEMFQDKLVFPFTSEDFYKQCLRLITTQSELVNESDQLAEFFAMFSYLVADHKLIEHEDWKIETVDSLNTRVGSKGGKSVYQVKQLDPNSKVLHLNFTKIFQLYKQHFRLQNGTEALPEPTLRSYMRDHKSFIGAGVGVSFNGQKTSTYAFYYDRLGLSLRRHGAVNQEPDVDVPVPEQKPVQSEMNLSGWKNRNQ